MNNENVILHLSVHSNNLDVNTCDNNNLLDIEPIGISNSSYADINYQNNLECENKYSNK